MSDMIRAQELQTEPGRGMGWARNLFLMAGVTLFVFLGIELFATIVFQFRDGLASKIDIDRRASADTYGEASWPNDYYKELETSNKARWVSYVYWRRSPFTGKYINVDNEGLRATWSSTNENNVGKDAKNILMLGGSTMWGLGARDEYTIPSMVAKQMTQHGIKVRVTNLAQVGYVSTQEVIALYLELRKGNIPDIVIFYDGFNDAMSAYQMAEAGLPQNEFNRIQEFNSSKKEFKVAPIAEFRNTVTEMLSSVRLTKALLHRAGFMMPGEPAKAGPLLMLDASPPSNAEPLAQDVADLYRANLMTVKALAKHYGFHVLFYWQPLLYDKTRSTPYEDENKRAHRKFQGFFEKTYQAVRNSELERSHTGMFHDLSRMFADTADPIFVDWCHIGETGNAAIAERMMVDVLPLVQKGKSKAT
jgi:lysophospholipase L1-like esterase